MGKLYLILCVATFLLVSLPAICGFDEAPMAVASRVTDKKPDDGLGAERCARHAPAGSRCAR